MNGMSFSQRQSQWANSALVVAVTPSDMLTDLGLNDVQGEDASIAHPLIGRKK